MEMASLSNGCIYDITMDQRLSQFFTHIVELFRYLHKLAC